MTTEVWSPVVGYEDFYEVSNYGGVRSMDRVVSPKGRKSYRIKGRRLSAFLNSAGRLTVKLSVGGNVKMAQVHVLVATAFIGPRPEGRLCCHKNDDPSDNSVSNLYWGTPKDNALDSVANGSHHHASKTHCKQGHLLSGTNLRKCRLKKGVRECVSCYRARRRCLRDGNFTNLEKISNEIYESVRPT